jgi:hypothetical protein
VLQSADQHCTRAALHCYSVDRAAQVNATSPCNGNGWYNCDDTKSPGFRWTDTLSQQTQVERVTITFQTGVDCVGTTRTGALNGGAELAYASPWHCSCSLRDSPTTLIFPGFDYQLGSDNTFLSTNTAGCLGFADLQSGPAAGNWADVCVYGTCMFVVRVAVVAHA